MNPFAIVRAALLAIALIGFGIGGTAHSASSEGDGIITAQSAGPGEAWYPYLLVRTPEGVSLFGREDQQGFAEAPECNQFLMVQAMQFGMQRMPVVQAWCSTDDTKTTLEKLQKQHEESEKPKGTDI